LIIDNTSIKRHGNPPKKVKELAEYAFNHGKSFSQSKDCVYIRFIEELESWSISDNYCRPAYKSILYNEKENMFTAYSTKNSRKALYNNNITPVCHAKQFFMPGIVDSLFKD
jgi:hypothetical protein